MLKSRYDFMTAGVSQDDDGSFFPDPLSLNYNKFIAEEYVEPYELDEFEISRIWQLMVRKYQEAIYDDVILTLNGVEHVNFLESGYTLYLPAKADIIRSFGVIE